MATYTEQFLLLTIDPVTGRPYPIPEKVLYLTLAGALLFDASFGGLINDDWQELTVLKSGSGNTAVDEALRCLLAAGRSLPLTRALALVAAHGETLHRLARESMQSGQLVSRRKKEIVARSGMDLYSIDIKDVIKIHKTIRHSVSDTSIPDYRLPALISLLTAGGLIRQVLGHAAYTEHRERIEWLAGIEALGREIVRAVRTLRSGNLERGAAALMGLNHDQPRTFAGGMDAVLSSLSHLYREAGISRSRRLLAGFNQVGGFECPGCAWPNPSGRRSHFEFCENGAKSVSAEATTKVAGREFFRQWPVSDLLLTSGYWLEQQGRLAEPMLLEENGSHYRPVSWDEAFGIIAGELRAMDHPDEAVFYASGKASAEAAFLWQLLARTLGTNNLPSSANLCHEPSGRALAMSLGFGKSSVTLEDFPRADAIFLFGHNPGSNHPRMLSSLQSAARKGCRIVAVNPMPEASLMGFADPQRAGSYFGRQTALASLFLQPVINGDMALVRGIAKAVFSVEEREGNVLDRKFISEYTNGFEAYRQLVNETTWEEIERQSGLDRDRIREAAAVYMGAGKVIASWCLGITHHRNAVETIREIINLLLLRGNIGRPGTGVSPVRGHSNIQGIRTAGAGEDMPVALLEAIEKNYGIRVPREPGLSAIPAIRAAAAGKVKVLLSLGGNLASSLPDTAFTEAALRRCSLTVMISTKLNRSHLVTGKRALILPCLSRTEEDVQNGSIQSVTVEDGMGHIGISKGCLQPVSPEIRSEVAIVAGIAAAVCRGPGGPDWQRAASDYGYVRTEIARTIPALKGIAGIPESGQGFRLENPLRKRIFPTAAGKALFSCDPLVQEIAAGGELMMMTIRSHDQFNTSVFGLNDRYRGINRERRVLFMNETDMQRLGIAAEGTVAITSGEGEEVRRLEGYYAVGYPIREGCCAAYFPEANVLVPVDHAGAICPTPAFKSIRVKVEAAVLGGGAPQHGHPEGC